MPRAAALTCVAQAGRTPAAPVAAQRALCAVDSSPRVDYSPPWGMASPCTQHWNRTVGCHPHHPTCPATPHFTQVAQVTQRTDSRTEAEVLNRPPGRAQVRVTRPGTRPACRCDGDGRGFYRCPGLVVRRPRASDLTGDCGYHTAVCPTWRLARKARGAHWRRRRSCPGQRGLAKRPLTSVPGVL